LNFHNDNQLKPPPRWNLLIINKLVSAYKLWDNFKDHFPKKYKSLVIKIDALLIEILELFFAASKLSGQRKLPILNKASGKLDISKFFFQFAWDLKILDNKKYILIAKGLVEIGKMLGNWLKSVEKQTLPK